MLPQRSKVGQGQPADPPRPVLTADPDERPGGLQGEDWMMSYFFNTFLCVIMQNPFF